jgi:hypothetical protein|tara:strand:- start:1890 stop:2336 length:447 start_codon:yes stop_codon:yes gene_type:complete
MAISNNIQGRQYDSYTQVTDGTALRVVTAPDDSSSGLVYSTGSTTVTTAQTVLVQKQTLSGRGGSWFVYNSGATAIDVEMYAAYASGAVNYGATGFEKVWDKVGSTQNIAATNTKHIPFNNKYRFVALVASTSAGTSVGVESYLYALN